MGTCNILKAFLANKRKTNYITQSLENLLLS